jgi:hypothetical protein
MLENVEILKGKCNNFRLYLRSPRITPRLDHSYTIYSFINTIYINKDYSEYTIYEVWDVQEKHLAAISCAAL